MNDHAQTTRRRGPLKLGFLSNVPFTSDAGGARRGLEEGIATFEYAESIGFDAGWVRQRHFDNYLASPITLLAAVSSPSLPSSIPTPDPVRRDASPPTCCPAADARLRGGVRKARPGLP